MGHRTSRNSHTCCVLNQRALEFCFSLMVEDTSLGKCACNSLLTQVRGHFLWESLPDPLPHAPTIGSVPLLHSHYSHHIILKWFMEPSASSEFL